MKTWHDGLHDFIQNTFENGTYTCEIRDVPLMPYDNIVDIFRQHVETKQTEIVEVLYSGGVDSELTLQVLKLAEVPVQALTMEMRVKNMIINTHDLYYAQKFCRDHDIKQRIVTLHVDKLFGNGDHLKYLNGYNVVQPNVAVQFWLFEQASHFPVIGGDWPWLQTHVNPRVLSPYRLDFMAGELFMRDSGIHGINNMISHSLDSCRLFVNEHYKMFLKHQELDTRWSKIGFFKQEMFEGIGVKVEPRVKAYGWEVLEIHPDLFDMNPIRQDLLNRVGEIQHVIKWNSVIGQAAEMPLGQNDSFK
jgi:hypothetical protein